MPRAKNEKNRRPTTPAAAERDQPPRAGQDADVHDSGLGLRPTAEYRRRDAIDVRGPDRDDAGLGLEPGGLPPGSAIDDADEEAAVHPHPHRTPIIAAEPDLTTTPHEIGDNETELSGSGIDVRSPDVDPDFTDQEVLSDPMAAVGDRDGLTDPVADGDEVYIPPTDPVVTTDAHGETEVLGGFSETAAESITPSRSASDGQIGDEAIADAVRAAMQHDSTTTDLAIRVVVRRGVVHLRGSVPDLDDAENAEAVARRVEGIVDVVEELEVTQV